ncbi:hypothetical protein [Pseudanabaena sp. UWO311]|uniref:hypothetical protein n=1 Tax=Pseudanabaena sp. UWO311 TaxID=2487337 RepID=UPI0016803A44|nr:hypothetical protein [Pseudanabaena sp. UWO311]
MQQSTDYSFVNLSGLDCSTPAAPPLVRPSAFRKPNCDDVLGARDAQLRASQ